MVCHDAPDQSVEQRAEHDPVRDAATVASQWMRRRWREQVLDEIEHRVIDTRFRGVHHGW